jgi:hypothetical protein
VIGATRHLIRSADSTESNSYFVIDELIGGARINVEDRLDRARALSIEKNERGVAHILRNSPFYDKPDDNNTSRRSVV